MPTEQPDQAAPSEVKGAESIVDQLAKGFESPEAPETTELQASAPEEDAEAAESSDGMEDVEYEGQTYKVPAALKEAIIHKADYTTKTQDVANLRRNVELLQDAMKAAQAEQAFTGSIAPELNQLAAFEARQKDLIERWNTLSSDEKQEIYLLDKQAEGLRKTIDGKRGEFRQKQTEVANDLKAKAREAVRKSIPNFSDKLAEEIAAHAIDEGYTRQEIDAIWDPRHAKTLWKAMQFDKLQKAAVQKPKAPAVVKSGPSASPMPQNVKADLNLRKAQKAASTSSDKAKVIEARLAASFAR